MLSSNLSKNDVMPCTNESKFNSPSPILKEAKNSFIEFFNLSINFLTGSKPKNAFAHLRTPSITAYNIEATLSISPIMSVCSYIQSLNFVMYSPTMPRTVSKSVPNKLRTDLRTLRTVDKDLLIPPVTNSNTLNIPSATF